MCSFCCLIVACSTQYFSTHTLPVIDWADFFWVVCSAVDVGTALTTAKHCWQRCLDYSFLGLAIRTLDYSYYGWTIRTLDFSYYGLFVPQTIRTVDYSYVGLFVRWTFRTTDYSCYGLFVPFVKYYENINCCVRRSKWNITYATTCRPIEVTHTIQSLFTITFHYVLKWSKNCTKMVHPLVPN